MLEANASAYDYRVKEIDEELINDAIISSTKIRKALAIGNIDTANSYLGYSYFFKGVVIEGNKLGRTIGFPTANLQITDSDKLIPGNGVYTVTAQLEGDARILKGMMNIGTRPTIDGTNRIIEVHLFDFNEDIYGRHLKVWIHHFLRAEMKFQNLEALQEQLQIDQLQTIERLN
jgi:riboflavin kinase/FMN adenylyltransferase